MTPKCPFTTIVLPLIEEEMAEVKAALKLKRENLNNFVADATLKAARQLLAGQVSDTQALG